jgi:hypothetical protein
LLFVAAVNLDASLPLSDCEEEGPLFTRAFLSPCSL